MENKRVPVGKVFWHIEIDNWGIHVTVDPDCRGNLSARYFESGNYFSTQKAAEIVSNKLNAVFKGADVVLCPHNAEFEDWCDDYCANHSDLSQSELEVAMKVAESVFIWLKSKIVTQTYSEEYIEWLKAKSEELKKYIIKDSDV